MRLRWISALAAIPVYIGLCAAGRAPFCVGLTVVAAIAAGELLRAYALEGIRPNPALVAAGALSPLAALLPPMAFGSQAGLLWALAAAVLLAALVWEVGAAAASGEMRAGRNMAWGLLCGAYLALFAGLAWLRAPQAGVARGAWPALETGAAWALLVTLCVWATDSFALFVGAAVGRHKLAPKLSPGKTVEGAAGGLAAGLLAGAGFGALLLGSAATGLWVGAIAGVFGQVGDLFESALKRELGIKDFGGILPGHGGALDRFDSLIVAASVVAVVLALAR